MIPVSVATWQTPEWLREVADAYRSVGDLCRALGIDPAPFTSAGADWPVRVPRPFARRIARGNPDDPLLRQVMPDTREDDTAPGFVHDPLCEAGACRGAGLLQKYAGRALLLATPSCAIHCRFCFRRHTAYADAGAGPSHWDTALQYVAADPAIRELVLSGGDPLMVADDSLARLFEELAALPQLRRLRIHTRLPVAIPSRVTDELLAMIGRAPWPVTVAIHVNHRNEIDGPVLDALKRLRRSGALLLSQTVLLRGVNDSPEDLAGLMEALPDAGVMPYYLHCLDPVAGAAHFEVPGERALALIRELRRRLPGYLVPRLVREAAGAPNKLPVEFE